jgi:hypothetical protein
MKDTDQAKEYFKKLRLAEKYCGGDTEVAKKILQGEYHDVVVIKARFKDPDEKFYGLFVMFINKLVPNIMLTNSIVSNYASTYQTKPMEYWVTFNEIIEREKAIADFDSEFTVQMNNALKRFLEIRGIKQMVHMVEHNQIKEITDTYVEVVNNVLKVSDSDVLVDFESTTSIILHEKIDF